jgi:hypothetical protein
VRHGIVWKLFIAVLLTLCVGVQLVELSSRWDRTIQDANDEAGIVAIVLCVGVALSVARTLLNRICRSRVVSRIISASLTPEHDADSRTVLPILIGSPPTSLRI